MNYQKITSQKPQIGVEWEISERRWKELTYVIGALAGLVLGALVGHLKNHFIWKKYLKRGSGSEATGSEATALYSRLITSNIVNVLTLVIAFFLMDLLPFDGIAFLIGTAAALTIMSRVLTMGEKKRSDL